MDPDDKDDARTFTAPPALDKGLDILELSPEAERRADAWPKSPSCWDANASEI